MALALGSLGKNTVDTGNNGQSVSIAGIVNMLSKLINQVSTEAEEIVTAHHSVSAYLMDEADNFTVDPVNPDQRAAALYEHFN